MSGLFVVVGLCVAWAITVAYAEHRAKRKGHADGYIEAMQHSLEMALADAIKYEDQRRRAYTKGKADGIKSMQPFPSVPAGTPTLRGVDFASGPDKTAVFWFYGMHRPGCQCNECTWPHKPNWRCSCSKCARHFDIG